MGKNANDGAAVSLLPTDYDARKALPLAAVLDYFPLAIAEVSKVIGAGQAQHGTTGWDRAKSRDDESTLLRHFMDRGGIDTDGIRHSAKMAWRALALLEKEIEAALGAPISRGSYDSREGYVGPGVKAPVIDSPTESTVAMMDRVIAHVMPMTGTPPRFAKAAEERRQRMGAAGGVDRTAEDNLSKEEARGVGSIAEALERAINAGPEAQRVEVVTALRGAIPDRRADSGEFVPHDHHTPVPATCGGCEGTGEQAGPDPFNPSCVDCDGSGTVDLDALP